MLASQSKKKPSGLHLVSQVTHIRIRLGWYTHRYQVFDHIHMWKGVNLGWFAEVSFNLVEAGQCVSTVDVHCARATDTCIYKSVSDTSQGFIYQSNNQE